MKIGILIYHAYYNYGVCLQVYVLQNTKGNLQCSEGRN